MNDADAHEHIFRVELNRMESATMSIHRGVSTVHFRLYMEAVHCCKSAQERRTGKWEKKGVTVMQDYLRVNSRTLSRVVKLLALAAIPSSTNSMVVEPFRYNSAFCSAVSKYSGALREKVAERWGDAVVNIDMCAT